MKIKIEFDLDNAAFAESGTENEIATILKEIATRVEFKGVGNGFKVMDSNGNSVGTVTYEE